MLGQTIQTPMQWKYDAVQITEKEFVAILDLSHSGIDGLYDNSKRPCCTSRQGSSPGFQMPPQDAVSIDTILLLNEPSDYPSILHRPFRGLSLSLTGSFHDDCEIFSPGRLLNCRTAAPLEKWDANQEGLFVAGRIEEVIVG
jgi:hypothetical protein